MPDGFYMVSFGNVQNSVGLCHYANALFPSGAVLGYDLTDIDNINTHLNGLMNLNPHALKD